MCGAGHKTLVSHSL